jgi:predicted dehydrogenase
MIGVCLVGAGRIATLHTLGYENNPKACIAAVCDKNKKRAENLANTLPGKVKIYTGYNDVLKDPGIDMVEILTPHHVHEDYVIKAARAKKHVSCQKVPALTLSGFDRMMDVVKKADIQFRVYENFRFHPPYQKALEMVNCGMIGEVEVVNFRMWGSEKPLSGWKVPLRAWTWRISENANYASPTLFDDGYHKHSVISLFLKDKIKSVRAWSNRQRLSNGITWDTPGVIIYETKKKSRYGLWNVSLGTRFPIHSDYYGSDEFLEIQGTEGVIFVNGCTGKMFQHSAPTGPGKPGIYWMGRDGKWQEDTSMPCDWKHSFIHCTRHFIDAIHSDTASPELDPQTARRILQIDLAVMRSMRQDARPVNITDIKDGIE